ncbi:hypothetical protein [Arthrobacter sp. H5]|uniref:hypothetical protein n=1 Tax=Arthrobacter sp. H5 TaxID=1267973 RepID=UPI000484FC44|nr:hypothetical protein [Arthrobacter sp. H5]
MAHPSQSKQPVRKHPTHSGEGRLLENLVVFTIMMVLFLCSIGVLAFGTLTTVWPWAVCLVLFFLAYWIPQTILGRSDTGGRQTPEAERKA